MTPSDHACSRLVVTDGDDLRLIDRSTGRQLRALPPRGRFVGATEDFIAVRSVGSPMLILHRLADGNVIEVPLPGDNAGPVVQAPGREELAFGAGSFSAATLLSLEIRGRAASVTPVDGPPATLRPQVLAWSPDGRHLFWVEPDGRIAVATKGVRTLMLRAPVDGVQQVLAFPSRR